MLVAVKKVMRAQRRVEVMHEVDVRRLVEARAGRQQSDARQNLLGLLVPGFREDDLVVLFVDEELAGRLRVVRLLLLFLLPGEKRRHLVHLVIDLGAVLRLARDDERCARLVDQDRVDLVDDRVVVGRHRVKALPTLYLVLDGGDHVVA